MPRSIILKISLAAFALFRIAHAQPAPIAEPQYINSFYAVDAQGNLVELEHETVTFHAKARALPGYVSAKMTTQFKPGHSPVRLPGASQFLVKGRGQIDPQSRFELRLLKDTKDHREFVMSQTRGSVFGASSTSNPSEGAIPIRFEEYGLGSYRITTEHPLEPGEYALTMRGFVTELYCFGVDR